MAVELKVPAVGESITEVEIGQWLKAEGQNVSKDENVVALESEKATVELSAPAAGVLSKIVKKKGEKASIGETVAIIESAPAPKEESRNTRKSEKPTAPAAAPMTAPVASPPASAPPVAPTPAVAAQPVAPTPTVAAQPVAPTPTVAAQLPAAVSPAPAGPEPKAAPPVRKSTAEQEVVRMTLLRRTVAKRLVEAQQTMAMLTTFNEIDLSAVIALRKEYQETFTRKHGVKLGFMSFFVKAVVEGLKAIPQLNASVQGDDITYHNFYNINIAIGSDKGLVVPMLRNAEQMSFAQIEKAIADFAARARENKLKPDELQSGTFTITNGGVYGSLLSTPIVNPPQSGILGMHAIQERPIAHAGNIVIRPMMYVALTYDHRIVDGREAVTFLVRVKELLETPSRMLLEI